MGFQGRSVITIDNYFGRVLLDIIQATLAAASAACIISNNAAYLSNYLLNIIGSTMVAF